jgi:hypothetical protein
MKFCFSKIKVHFREQRKRETPVSYARRLNDFQEWRLLSLVPISSNSFSVSTHYFDLSYFSVTKKSVLGFYVLLTINTIPSISSNLGLFILCLTFRGPIIGEERQVLPPERLNSREPLRQPHFTIAQTKETHILAIFYWLVMVQMII